jgi:hypothetical protein
MSSMWSTLYTYPLHIKCVGTRLCIRSSLVCKPPSKFRPMGRFYCCTEKKSLFFKEKKIKFTAKFKFLNVPVTRTSFDQRLNAWSIENETVKIQHGYGWKHCPRLGEIWIFQQTPRTSLVFRSKLTKGLLFSPTSFMSVKSPTNILLHKVKTLSSSVLMYSYVPNK